MERGRASDAPPAEEIEEEIRNRIAERLRVGGVVTLAATLAFDVLDMAGLLGAYDPRPAVQFGVGLASLAALVLPSSASIRRHATVTAVALTTILLVLLTVGNVARHDSQAYATLSLICVLVAGGLFPWGIAAQSFVTLASIACLAWASSAIGGPFRSISYDAATLVALGIGYCASLFLARQHRAWRVAMLIEQSRLRDAQNRITAVNAALEQCVRDRTIELEEAITDLSEFGYSVSHDLRQPLRAVCGFAQIIEQDAGAELDPAARGFISRIQSAALRMDHIIDELLRHSRIGTQRLRRTRVDVGEMATSMSLALAARDPSRSVEWIIERPLIATGDPVLLSVLLENLLGNAWNSTAASERPRIEFGMEKTDAEQIFYVRDNGSGFDEAEAERALRPLTRFDDGPGLEGFSAALVTAQRIVHRHGGRMWVKSKPRNGTELRFTLPASLRLSSLSGASMRVHAIGV